MAYLVFPASGAGFDFAAGREGIEGGGGLTAPPFWWPLVGVSVAVREYGGGGGAGFL